MSQRFNARTKSGAPGHPISSVKMLRGALIALEEGEDAMIRFSFVSFDAYWGTLVDVNDDDVVLEGEVWGAIPRLRAWLWAELLGRSAALVPRRAPAFRRGARLHRLPDA